MATPFKRVCPQVVRQKSKQRFQCLSQRSFAESQPTQTSWVPAIQCRTYASRPQQPLEPEEPIPEDLIESLPSPSDLSSTAHAELVQHRELRELVRLAAWEMPLLSSLSKPFQPPSQQDSPLRWRYTTYFGDTHPSSRKVVVKFNVHDLHELNEKQQEKLKKLCGTRYNPEENSVRMSSESFETQAQNKRFLGDTIQNIIREATDPDLDNFEDIPLDIRHYKVKTKLRFPEEWKLDAEKKKALDEKRKNLLLAEGKRVETNSVVNGIAAIEAARQVKLAQIEEPVMAEATQALSKGKKGKKEMGQTKGVQR